MSEQVSIYIDGANFYHLVLKKMGIREIDFDYEAFANMLAGSRQIGNRCKRFYVGTVRERKDDEKSKAAMSNQNALFSSLISSGWEVKTSKLRERREKLTIDSRVEGHEQLRKKGVREVRFVRNREKGIDVKLVTDLFIGAIDKKYDTAIIVSSDTDLVPAIDSVRHRLGRKIEYIGFSISDPTDPANNTTPLLSMIPRTDKQRTFVESDIRPFIKLKLL